MKKLYYLLIIILCFIFFPNIVNANSIHNIDMDIYVDNNGNATVTEKWTVDVEQGTEGYKPYYNLGNATITDFTVSENNVTYTNIGTWNTETSFSNKAYKNGINYISNGIELCWGISKYGSHVYTLSYKINGFVAETSDSQIIYWTLIPYELSSKPGNVHIKIYSDNKYSKDLPVWGYGNYGGTAYVYDGYIEMNSEGTLDSDEYMTILVKFAKGTFTTTNVVENDFDYYYDKAEEGAVEYVEDDDSSGGFFKYFIWIAIIGGIIAKSSKGSNKVGKYTLDFGKRGKKFRTDIPYYRDIPCEKNIYNAYFISVAFNLIKNKTDVLGAVLLKWLKEDKISVKKVKSGIFHKESMAIDLKDSKFELNFETDLYDMMKEAAKDNILEQNEFEKWCKKNYDDILKWFDKTLNYAGKNFEENGYLNNVNGKKYLVTDKMFDESEKLKGLKEFLIYFSRINEKQPIEVKLWEEYLMFAQIFGIAKEVAKQFKKLYPDIIDNYNYDFDTIIFINMISYNGMVSATTARAQSYSAGGGGFSSGGGGGGSFGGGGGGGGFR